MFCTVIFVKDTMEHVLPAVDPTSPTKHADHLQRSAIKSAAAGIAGAALTNPLDVIRNEMFKTSQPITKTTQNLFQEVGVKFLVRGIRQNIMAVAMPIGCTIFFTDALIQRSKEEKR